MTTTLLNCEIELSKQMGDHWSSTTTGTGSSSTNIQDTALKAKENDWVTDDCYIMITDSTADNSTNEEERKATALDNDTGDLTVLDLSGDPGDGKTYRVHRLFTASDKRIALIYAARMGFPHIHDKIWDESIVSGNWLKDGSFESWSSDTALNYWAKNGSCTLGKTTTSPYYKHGATSCKISGTTDYIYQDIAKWDDLKRLAGKTVTFTAQVWADTASSCRLAILYDGTNLTYSDYHDGSDTWTTDSAPLSVSVDIDDNPTDIEFRIYYATSGNIYVDDARVISSVNPRLYIAHLGLAQEYPTQVFVEPSNYSTSEPWTLIHNAVVDTENGYLYLPSGVTQDLRLRIIGMGYLDFLASGVSSTTWASTINIEKPQTDILYAEAMVYLYNQMILPNYTAGVSDRWKEASAYWQGELRARRGKHSMPMPSVPVKWR